MSKRISAVEIKSNQDRERRKLRRPSRYWFSTGDGLQRRRMRAHAVFAGDIALECVG
jgi:hypothetical protein